MDYCWVGADPGVFNFSRVSKDLLDLQEQKGLQETRQVSYPSLSICLSLHTDTSFLCLSLPTTYPIPSFSVLANSSVVRDGKDLARVLGARRKDKVRPLESQREPWIYQGECRTQPGVDFGREGRKEGQGWVWDRVRCNRSSWSGSRSRREADGVRTEPTALGESLGTDRPQGGPAVLDCEGRE